MSKFLYALILVALSVLVAGCGTLVGYMAECFAPECRKPIERIEYYQAVKTDVAIWNLPEEDGQIRWIRWVSKPFLIVDFTISAVVDTVLLPFQVGINISKSDGITKKSEAETSNNESTQ